MTPTHVVTLRTIRPGEEPPGMIYVGRATPRSRHACARVDSPFGNPGLGMREYRAYVLSRPDLVALLPTLRGRALACWCCDTVHVADEVDRVCHAEILADLADGRESPV